MRKLLKVLLAVGLTALVTEGCAHRPRYNDLVPKTESAKELFFRVVDAETGAPIPDAVVELGESKSKWAQVADANGVVRLPVAKKYRDENSTVVVTLAKGLPRYRLEPAGVAAEGAAPPPPPPPAAGNPPPGVGAEGEHPAVAKGFDFKPSNPANGVLVVYRNAAGMMGSGAMQSATLKVDGQAVGDVPHDTYVVVELAPGKHTVTAVASSGESNWVMEAAAGRVDYAELQPLPVRLVSTSSAAGQVALENEGNALKLGTRANLAPSN